MLRLLVTLLETFQIEKLKKKNCRKFNMARNLTNDSILDASNDLILQFIISDLVTHSEIFEI